MKNNIKIIFTGGHARATAYSIIQEIKKRHSDWTMYWAGSRDVLVGKHVQSMESTMFPKIGVKFLPIISGRIQRRFTWWTIPEFLKIPVGFVFAIYHLLHIKPTLLVSMGGFAAFPMVVMARFLKVKIIIHEQTSAAGRANILSAKFADKIALAREESKKYFDSKKCIVTGNPISGEVRKIKVKKSISERPTLLVTGGASGSQKINNALKEVLLKLLAKFNVIHQAGDYQYAEFTTLKKTLPKIMQNKYQVFSTIYPWEWSGVLEKADVVVSRAGANIVSEIMLTKIPALLIPIPFSYLNEQVKNATSAAQFGIATVLDEENLSSRNLFNKILETIERWNEINKNTSGKVSPDINAHKKVVDLIETLVGAR